MMKQLVGYIFLVFATSGLLLHGVVPHHHHSEKKVTHQYFQNFTDVNELLSDCSCSLDAGKLAAQKEDCTRHIHVCSFIDARAYYKAFGVKVSSVFLTWLTRFNLNILETESIFSTGIPTYFICSHKKLPDSFLVDSLKFRGPPYFISLRSV